MFSVVKYKQTLLFIRVEASWWNSLWIARNRNQYSTNFDPPPNLWNGQSNVKDMETINCLVLVYYLWWCLMFLSCTASLPARFHNLLFKHGLYLWVSPALILKSLTSSLCWGVHSSPGKDSAFVSICLSPFLMRRWSTLAYIPTSLIRWLVNVLKLVLLIVRSFASEKYMLMISL